MLIKRIFTIVEVILIFSIAGIYPKNAWIENSDYFISSPISGETIQGLSLIRGSTEIEGFEKYEIAFGFDNESNSSWFLIQSSRQSVQNDLLANWDTNLITDGIYRLRLRIFLKNGTIKEKFVDKLRIQNYSIITTDTPISASNASSPSNIRSSSTPVLMATNLAVNPMVVSTPRIIYSMVTGAGMIFVLILVVWIYGRFKVK